MKRFHNMLAYVKGKPGEDIGLRRAVTLARNNGARLTLLAVVDRDHPHEPRRAHRWALRRDHRLGSLSAEHLFEQRRSELEDHAAALRDRGVLAETVVVFGRPAGAILDQVARAEHDVVFKTANPEDSSYRRFFGTTAIELMRACPCPVWVVRGREPGPHRILAAIDPVDMGERHELNQQVLQISATLAEQEGGELHVVHAWDALGLNALGGRVVATDLADYVHSVRRAVARSVHSYLRDLGELGVRLRKNRHIHLPRGAPWRRIPDIVLAIGASTVVMGTVARRGLHGYLLGNTAERVLPRVPASVIAVKGQTLSQMLRARLSTAAPDASGESRDATAGVVS